ncbi:TRL-like family protein [Helicobacter canis]|uniref:Protein trl n=1 Tax=Helicobacter canis TaxID=29419 RepID=A0A5M9QHF7_9HELI|nr:TRL-like family protein [Helicobacter canis]KAA8707336.1 hypothetical protein F4V45_08625 [Helicobacter canis]
MKGIFVGLSMAAALALFSGCATTAPVGALYTDASLPVTATSASGASKEGQATCTSILSLVATGDCSVETAAKNGHIQSIKSVDSKVFSVLGIYSTYTTIVRGN